MLIFMERPSQPSWWPWLMQRIYCILPTDHFCPCPPLTASLSSWLMTRRFTVGKKLRWGWGVRTEERGTLKAAVTSKTIENKATYFFHHLNLERPRPLSGYSASAPSYANSTWEIMYTWPAVDIQWAMVIRGEVKNARPVWQFNSSSSAVLHLSRIYSRMPSFHLRTTLRTSFNLDDRHSQ